MDTQLLTRAGLPAPTEIKMDGRGPYCEIELACSRCGGTGRTNWKSDPVCEGCEGQGVSDRTERIRLYTREDLDRLNDALAAKRERDAQKQRQQVDALKREHGNLLDAADAIHGENASVARILTTIHRSGRLSDAQKASLERAIADHTAGDTSQHVGTIGSVIETTVRVTRVARIKPSAGRRCSRTSRYALTFTDTQGEQLIAFLSTPYAEGETLDITARVQDHIMWRGRRQTLLTGLKQRRGAT